MELYIDITRTMSRPTDKQLLRYVSGEADQKERIKITDWASEDDDNDLEIRMYRKLHLAVLLNAEPERLEENERRPRILRAPAFRWSVAILSAAAVMLLGVFVGTRYIDRPNEPTRLYPVSIQAPKGQRTHTFLSDGTEVWLNSNSRLCFKDNDKDCRIVSLDGEAWFSVARNERSPFIVETPKNKIQVLGTVFDVRAYKSDDDFMVKLYEGKVEVKDVEDETICTLLPNEMLIASDGGYEKKEIDTVNSIDWKAGFYSFRNKSYSQIFKTIGAYYDVNIVVSDKEIEDYRCTGRFKQEYTLNQVLSSMASIHDFKWEWSEDNTTVRIYK